MRTSQRLEAIYAGISTADEAHLLATGLAIRDDGAQTRLLLVASRYANHAQPLWNLPGGRQHPGELLRETVERECYEETGLRVRVGELAYVSESYDGDAVTSSTRRSTLCRWRTRPR